MILKIINYNNGLSKQQFKNNIIFWIKRYSHYRFTRQKGELEYKRGLVFDLVLKYKG